jgi:hypothetical protein
MVVPAHGVPHLGGDGVCGSGARRGARASGDTPVHATDMGLDIVETFLAVEQEFGIEVPNAEAARMATVGALFDYVRAHVSPEQRGAAADAAYAGPLWERYVDLLHCEIGGRRDALRPEASWVDDLRLD